MMKAQSLDWANINARAAWLRARRRSDGLPLVSQSPDATRRIRSHPGSSWHPSASPREARPHPYCHVYGFHDLRRAFVTLNAEKLTPDALQALMRHKSYQKTQVYINLAQQMDAAVASLHV